MKFKFSAGIIAAFSAIALMISACGGDSGSSANDELPERVEQFSDIKNIECNEERECAQIYIKEHDDYVQCVDSKWETVVASKPNDACAEANAKSSSSKAKSSSSGETQSNSSEKNSSSSKKNTASSSSGKKSSSSVRSDLVGKVNWQYLNPNREYGEITDERDGQVYKTVKIYDQVWMAENLNFEYNEGSAKSSCYEDVADSCAYYGRLYTWAAAMDSVAKFSPAGEFCGDGILCNPEGEVRGVCPSGWHLPTQDEWSHLKKNISGTAYGENGTAKVLMSTSGWYIGLHTERRGNNNSGFSAVSADGYYACFWTTQEDNGVYSRKLAYGAKLVVFSDFGLEFFRYDKDDGCSVRCIKDAENEEFLSSSSEKSSSSSVTLVDPSTVIKGTMTDERDGNTYKTVTIGTQTWMAENLNFEYDEASAKSSCYEDVADSCDKYGRLYSWPAAMDAAAIFSDAGKGCGNYSTCKVEGVVRGVCPIGWHLPDSSEWGTLLAAVGGARIAGVKLKSNSGWEKYGENGLDSYSFTVLPTGYKGDPSYYSVGEFSGFWTPRSVDQENACAWYFSDYRTNARYDCSSKRIERFSVRCIKDED